MARPQTAQSQPIRRNERSAGIVQSSLDMVWSYTRSQNFLNEMATSPSFVHHYDPRRYSQRVSSRPSIPSLSSQPANRKRRESIDSDALLSDMPDSSVASQDQMSLAEEEEALSDEWDGDHPSFVNEQTPLSQAPAIPAALPKPRPRPVSYGAFTSTRDSKAFPKDGKAIFSEAEIPELSFGMSTFAQSFFNSVNVLVGVGILAEPLAFAHAGWIGGMIILLFCGYITNYTAKLLARILAKRPHLHSYTDIAAEAFGSSARFWISVLFCLELSALSVALVVLWGDSMNTLLPYSKTFFKVLGFFLITPTLFLPLHLLSFTSLIGIFSTISLLVVVLVDGISKREAPGSLVQPAITHLGPDWPRLPLSFGLVMSGFAGHAVMPSIARDMKNPRQFDLMINCAYVVVFGFYCLMAVSGYLMFGDDVSEEISKDLLKTQGYPRIPTRLAVWAIALNPICKFAIGTRPLNTTVEYVFGLDAHHQPADSDTDSLNSDNTPQPREGSLLKSTFSRLAAASASAVSRLSLAHAPKPVQQSARAIVKISTTALVVVVAIFLPGFEAVMSFLGAFSAFVICVYIPILANHWLNWKDISRTAFIVDLILLAVSTVMCVSGTALSFVKV